MEEDAAAAITVVVRAPDQTASDFVVECFENWTVKKLKCHLSQCYPSQPDERRQKIIYCGKLLTDNSVLKDVFRVQEDHRHTVHLVCVETSSNTKSTTPVASTVPTPNTTATATSTTPTAPDPSTIQPTPGSSGSMHDVHNTDGLRERSNSSYGAFYSYNYGGYGMPYGGNVQTPSYYQAYWMQQYYAQMAHYAQYSNQQITPAPNVLNANVNVNPAPAVNLAAPPVVANVNLPNNAQANQNNVRMNAGVGPAIDDDDDDQLNRDWLDWTYMLFRALVLVSIVYFYSSMNRFMIVVGAIAFIYLYQKRLLYVQRQQAARVVNEAAGAADAAAAAANEAAADGVEQTPQQNENSNQEPMEGEENSENEPESENATDSPLPPPSVLSIVWVFFSSFFTSLIPHGPEAVNAN